MGQSTSKQVFILLLFYVYESSKFYLPLFVIRFSPLIN